MFIAQNSSATSQANGKKEQHKKKLSHLKNIERKYIDQILNEAIEEWVYMNLKKKEERSKYLKISDFFVLIMNLSLSLESMLCLIFFQLKSYCSYCNFSNK